MSFITCIEMITMGLNLGIFMYLLPIFVPLTIYSILFWIHTIKSDTFESRLALYISFCVASVASSVWGYILLNEIYFHVPRNLCRQFGEAMYDPYYSELCHEGLTYRVRNLLNVKSMFSIVYDLFQI